MTLDRLYRDVENLKKQYRGLAGGPQLALSSIENGAIDSKDADGNLKMTIGQQDDGGNTINVISGPTPPTPIGFTIDVDHGKFIVHWSGDFDGEALAPSDWSRAEVHASQDPSFVPDRTTARGSIVSAAGGEVTIGVLKGPWTIKMLAWSQAGKMSGPSAPVDVEVPGYGEIVLEEIDAAQTEIVNGGSILLDAQDTLDGKFDSAFIRIGNAESDANAARTAAQEAKSDAEDAASAAADAVGIAGGKADVLIQSATPSSDMEKSTTLWIDTTGGANTPKRWSGTEWVVVTDQTAVDAAQAAAEAKQAADEARDTANQAILDAALANDNATAALESANGKNVVHYEDHAPTSSDEGAEGDTWFVGQAGRPNDVVLATNLAVNPSFEGDIRQNGIRISSGGGSASELDTEWSLVGSQSVKNVPSGSAASAFYPWVNSTSVESEVSETIGFEAGKTYTISGTLRLAESQVSPGGDARKITIGTIIGGSQNWGFASSPQAPNTPGEHRLSVTFTVPENAMMFVRLMNGSPETPAWWDGLQIGESSSYFDGDTPDGPTDNDPHYRWTGTPHASTSEKYLPALDIGDDDTWNVTEQYRFQSGEWVQVELSHTVLSSLDLGKLVAGSAAIKEAVVQKLFAEVVVARMSVADEFIGENAILTGAVTAPKITASEELWAQIANFVKIRSEHIESDAIDGMVVRGLTLIAGNDRHRLDDSGYALFDDNGDRRTFLSPDGSTFKGEVEAETFVANGGAELRGTNNTLAQGAKLTLAAGVTDPTAPPVVQPYWEGVEFTPPSDATPVGLAFDGTHYWTAEAWPEIGAAWKIDAATGAAERVSLPASWGRLFGVTCIGSELYWLTLANHTSKVIVTDLNLSEKRDFEFEDIGFSSTNPLVYEPGIGTDGTNVLIGHCSDGGTLYLRTYNPTTGAKTATVSSENFKNDVTGAFRGSADFGMARTVVSRPSSYQFRVGGTDLAYDGSRSWDGPSAAEVAGFCWTGARFASIGADGKITEYADSNTGDESGDWWATYYWYTDVDDDDIIESSDYRSRMAPPKRFTWPRRAGLKILGQPLPDGVEALGPALAKKTSTPARTDFSGPGWRVDSGKPSARYLELPTNWSTFASPSEENTYPNATPSALESASSTFQLKGDGSGRWGPLTFGADGTMTGIPKMAVGKGETVTVTSGGFNTKTVTFPQGRFTTPPTVVVSADTTSEALINVGALTVTKDGFTLSVRRTNSTPTGVDWIAMEVN